MSFQKARRGMQFENPLFDESEEGGHRVRVLLDGNYILNNKELREWVEVKKWRWHRQRGKREERRRRGLLKMNWLSYRMGTVMDDEIRKRLLQRAQSIALRRLRHRTGLSQLEVAKRCGLDRAYLGQIERGEHSPTLDLLDRILTAMRLDMTHFGMALAEARSDLASGKINGPELVNEDS